jgi:hypothetical protein
VRHNIAQLSFTAGIANTSFTAANSVVNGIHAIPNQFTGGEGQVTGKEVQINITFLTPFVLRENHVFFRPEMGVTNGDFLWLSAPRPIVPPGTPLHNRSAELDSQRWARRSGSGLGTHWYRRRNPALDAAGKYSDGGLLNPATPQIIDTCSKTKSAHLLIGGPILFMKLTQRLYSKDQADTGDHCTRLQEVRPAESR